MTPPPSQDARLVELGARVARIVHEINAPTSLLSGGLDHLETCFGFLLSGSGPALPEGAPADGDRWTYSAQSVPEVLRICRDAVAQLGGLVDEIYAYLRGTGDAAEHADWTDVAAEVERAARAALARRRAHRPPTVERAVPDGLRIRCAPGALGRVLVNVIGNAYDAVAGRPDPRVSVAGRRIEAQPGAQDLSWVEIEVRDNGPGIPPAIYPKIFDPFFTTKAGGSLGLGLAIARETVEANGGAIIAAASPEGGASFLMRFPGASGDETARAASSHAARALVR